MRTLAILGVKALRLANEIGYAPTKARTLTHVWTAILTSTVMQENFGLVSVAWLKCTEHALCSLKMFGLIVHYSQST